MRKNKGKSIGACLHNHTSYVQNPDKTEQGELVSSYQAVGKFLGDESSPLAPYKPEIQPQGSFLLGTMITPVNENDDLDIDLVCELMEKHPDWTAENLKAKVGEKTEGFRTIQEVIGMKRGRRCWTLLYR